MDKDDIEKLLNKWYETKQEIALLEKKCEKYKRYSEKILNNLPVPAYENLFHGHQNDHTAFLEEAIGF